MAKKITPGILKREWKKLQSYCRLYKKGHVTVKGVEHQSKVYADKCERFLRQ